MKRVIVPSINNFGPIQTKEGEYIEEKVRRTTRPTLTADNISSTIHTESNLLSSLGISLRKKKYHLK